VEEDMADDQPVWVSNPPLDQAKARVDQINKSGSPTKYSGRFGPVDVGDVFSLITARFSRPLTDAQRTAIKSKIMAEVEVLAPGLLLDFEIRCGIEAFNDPLLEDREWNAYYELHLRTEEPSV
jgi:hypothetical protein